MNTGYASLYASVMMYIQGLTVHPHMRDVAMHSRGGVTTHYLIKHLIADITDQIFSETVTVG